jgi:hypothetical protein
MKRRLGSSRYPSRRGLVQAAAGLAATRAGFAGATGATATRSADRAAGAAGDIEPFNGEHQGGITTLPQRHSYFAGFDLVTARRDEIIGMLRAWTIAAPHWPPEDRLQRTHRIGMFRRPIAVKHSDWRRRD